MKILMTSVLLLTLTAGAFGSTTMWLVESGTTNTSIDVPVGGVPATLSLDVMVNYDFANNFALSGAISGPGTVTIQSLTVNTVAGTGTTAAFSGWTLYEAPVGSALSAGIDIGALADATPDTYAPAGTMKYATVVLNLGTVSGTLAGNTLSFGLGDAASYAPFGGTGYWASQDGPIGNEAGTTAFDSTAGFALNVTPEPTTMLLLALALPFLRRRSA